MSSREEMLARIRAVTADISGQPEVPRRYRPAARGPGSADEALVGLFEERAGDYRATVRRSAAGEVARAIADAVAARGAKRIGVPDGFPAEWSALLTDVVGPPLDVAALDGLDGVVTTVAVAIAETGTIVLDTGPGQGSRAFSLVPDYHLAVVRTGQIVGAVPDAVAALDPTRPLTWISGPSATSDIELSRVEGVHGPRTLDIVIVTELGGDGLAGQPGGAAFVEPVELGAGQAWHVGLDRVPGLDLQVGQVAVTLGEAGQHVGIQGERRGRVDRVQAVLLVDRLAQHDRPAAVALLEEVVEPAGAGDVADHAVDRAALHDRHPGLGDGARSGLGDPDAAGEVQDVDTAGGALLADPDEVFLRALEPGRHHVAVLVPAGPERLPVPGVPGVRPGLDDIPDGQAVSKRSVHSGHGSA